MLMKRPPTALFSLCDFATLEKILLDGKVSSPAISTKDMVPYTAIKAHGSSSRGRAIASNYEVVL